MMNHTIFLGSVEVVKLEHFTCLEHRTVKEKGRYYKLKGQKHYNFMVLPRLGSLVRSNQSIDQKKKKKLSFGGLDNASLAKRTHYTSSSFPSLSE